MHRKLVQYSSLCAQKEVKGFATLQEQEKLLTSLRKELNVGLEKHAVSARTSLLVALKSML